MGIPGLNKEVLDKIVKTLGLQSAVERLPVDLATNIQPVLDVNPERIVNVCKTTASTGTLYTTPSDRDFYMTYCYISNTSNNAAATAIDTITVVLESGESVDLLRCPNGSQAATTNTNSIKLEFENPIKLKKGSNVTVSINNTVGVTGIGGYTVDIL